MLCSFEAARFLLVRLCQMAVRVMSSVFYIPVNANFCKDDTLESSTESRTKAAFLTYFKARCTVDDHHIKATTFTLLFTDVQHIALGVWKAARRLSGTYTIPTALCICHEGKLITWCLWDDIRISFENLKSAVYSFCTLLYNREVC